MTLKYESLKDDQIPKKKKKKKKTQKKANNNKTIWESENWKYILDHVKSPKIGYIKQKCKAIIQ